MGAEAIAGALGFAATVHLARGLGPRAFADLEYATAVAAWLLVLVRGGIEVIVYREAARRPSLIHPLTEVLLGLRLAGATVGYGLVASLAILAGPGKGTLVAIAGLILVPSTFAADVGPKARGRFWVLALAQGLRAVGFAGAAFALVGGPGDAWRAAGCGLAGEFSAWLVPFALHAREFGVPRPRFRGLAWIVLARRGAVAGLTRFGRVTLYGADLLALGVWAGAHPELGAFAAARRVALALAGIGLVVPAAVGPLIARRWIVGTGPTRALIGRVEAWTWGLALPAAVGLALTERPVLALLFGEGYRSARPWLALVAARLPFLLSGSTSLAALVACRREGDALRLVLGTAALALTIVPASAGVFGPWGAGVALLIVEVVVAWGGSRALRRANLAPSARHLVGTLLGCLAMALACRATEARGLAIEVLAGVVAYGIVRGLWQRLGPDSRTDR